MRHALSVVLFVPAFWIGPARPCGAAGPAPAPDRPEPAGEGVALLVRALAKNDDPQLQLDVLKGMNAAMEGRRRVAAPPEWPVVRDKLLRSRHPQVRSQAQSLAVVFGDAV